MNVGVFTNPNSSWAAKYLSPRESLESVVVDKVPYYVTECIDQLSDVLMEFRSCGIDAIIVRSGDGGFQRLITEAVKLYDKLPFFVPTMGGNVNFVAKKWVLNHLLLFHVIFRL